MVRHGSTIRMCLQYDIVVMARSIEFYGSSGGASVGKFNMESGCSVQVSPNYHGEAEQAMSLHGDSEEVRLWNSCSM